MSIDTPTDAAAPSAPTTTSSPFHKIANASLWCLGSLLGVNILLGPATRMAAREGTVWLSFVVTAATTLLMLAAMICGVIALCGISRYGKRELLWKGLVGLLVPILLVAAAIPAFFSVRKRSMERARQQQQSAP